MNTRVKAFKKLEAQSVWEQLRLVTQALSTIRTVFFDLPKSFNNLADLEWRAGYPIADGTVDAHEKLIDALENAVAELSATTKELKEQLLEQYDLQGNRKETY